PRLGAAFHALSSSGRTTRLRRLALMSSRSRWFIYLVFFSFIILMNALSVTPALAQDSPSPLPKRIVADYGYWSRTQDPPYGHEQIPYHKLTHINHAGVSFNADGSLSVPDGFLEPELNKKAHDAGVKVMLLLGGDFDGLDASGAVDTLVANIAAFAQEHHYDGVDMDWEYPATTEERNFFVKLMKALRESNPDYTLSIDVAPWGGYGYDLKHLQLSLDYFNMGTPFYGYHYTNINQLFGLCPNAANTADGECDNTVLTVNYAPWVKDRINKNGWYTQYDPIALVPYMLRTD